MEIGVPAETTAGESRVAVALASEVVLKVRAPREVELATMRPGAAVVGMLNPFDAQGLQRLAAAGLTAFALEAAPRTTRAQSMDVLSSQANIAGYKAVMLAANLYQRFFPMLMTAAGTVKAARIVVLGVGVAGLQAIATAKRLGAVIEASDVRPLVKEQVVAAVVEPWAFGIVAKGEPIPAGNRLERFLGAAIGAITFSGSVIAFGKLSGKYKFRLFQGAPVVFSGQHMLNLVLGLATVGLGLSFMMTESWSAFFLMLALAFVLGVLIIIPIGGADMPVVVSMLNSYSGWAAAGIGFSLNNSMLIIAGSRVGSSGAILSYIMCKAMNRSFFNVVLGGFGGDAGAAAQGTQQQRSVKSGSADDAAFILGNAETAVIVPGYGLAVARAQHAVKELAEKLTHKGITVKYAIHPVAGRMPGHMNVLLAEAEVPYDQVFEIEDINGEFGQADVATILGANYVGNPAALT